MIRAVALLIMVAVAPTWALAAPGAHASHPWQTPMAEIVETGDLRWQPRPFTPHFGGNVRYIDFERGADSNPGTRAAPWKHHPWDPDARGLAQQSRGSVTYVFKRGVIYRGALRPGADRGTPEEPIRLTSDPTWGEGDAVLQASERVTGWKRGSHPRMPGADQVWYADLPFKTRAVWLVDPGQPVRRLNLARHPNWTEPEPFDPMSQWPTWENPEWWRIDYSTKVGHRDRHLGIDRSTLTGEAADYVGGTVWTEWGFVMGSPYPARIDAFDREKRAIAFRGPWTFEKSERITSGMRYYLEDMPQWLDEPGEFWVEERGEGARLYLRLPNDRNPNEAVIEAGRHSTLLDAEQLHHVTLSGLTFRFTNMHWRYDIPAWADPELRGGVIRLIGSGDGIEIAHCTFAHVHMPVRVSPSRLTDKLGTIRFTDNIVTDTDHGGVLIEARFAEEQNPYYAPLGNVEILRNRMSRIGWRVLSGEHGHAIDVRYARTSHIAGNVLDRLAAGGIQVFGGKPDNRPGPDVPLSRHVIHHNRVEDALLKSNDWGAIETWQGGPFYVYSNVVINPVGYQHWLHRPRDPKSIGGFGHAYYLDGSHKSYYFNNLAIGRNNTLGTKGVNAAAVQAIFGLENTIFNNTFYRFAEMSRQQEPTGGRLRYISNVFVDASKFAMRHGDPPDGEPDPNAHHFQTPRENFAASVAYTGNVFYDVKQAFGTFGSEGRTFATLASLQRALQAAGVAVPDVGVLTSDPPIRNAAAGDLRPAARGPVRDQARRVFVPWALAGTVGEWHFTLPAPGAVAVADEHWYMTGNYDDRRSYKDQPRYPLEGRNITREAFVDGQLETWTRGALALDGRTQYLALPHAKLAPVGGDADTPPSTRTSHLAFADVTAPAELRPGQPFEVTVAVRDAADATGLRADLHTVGSDGRVTFLASGRRATGSRADRSFTVAFPPVTASREGTYSLYFYVAPDGRHANRTKEGAVSVPAGARRSTFPQPTVALDRAPFLIEAVIRPEAPGGVLVAKHDGAKGYRLDLDEGRLRLTLGDGARTAIFTTDAPIATGRWTHVLVESEVDGAVTFYVDGRSVTALRSGDVPTGSLATTADFLVGGGPGLPHFAGQFDFLRIARGTLSQSQTTIDELYDWQFRGPASWDFTNTPRTDGNAAGALVR